MLRVSFRIIGDHSRLETYFLVDKYHHLHGLGWVV